MNSSRRKWFGLRLFSWLIEWFPAYLVFQLFQVAIAGVAGASLSGKGLSAYRHIDLTPVFLWLAVELFLLPFFWLFGAAAYDMLSHWFMLWFKDRTVLSYSCALLVLFASALIINGVEFYLLAKFAIHLDFFSQFFPALGLLFFSVWAKVGGALMTLWGFKSRSNSTF